MDFHVPRDMINSHGFETDLTGYLFVISHGFPLFLRVKRGLSITVDVRRLDSYCVARDLIVMERQWRRTEGPLAGRFEHAIGQRRGPVQAIGPNTPCSVPFRIVPKFHLTF